MWLQGKHKTYELLFDCHDIHHDEGNLQKKVFNLAYCFRGFASMMAEKKGLAGGTAESSYLDSQADGRVGILGMV